MTDEMFSTIQAAHQPDPWIEKNRQMLWCKSDSCHQAEGDEAVHVDWPCDAARLVTEVRRLRRENVLLTLSRGTPSVTVGQD